jgi:hypothetical protein
MIQVPLDAQFWALQRLFELLLQWSNIWDVSALQTPKCLLIGYSTLQIVPSALTHEHEILNSI